jgi:hypothetical protein
MSEQPSTLALNPIPPHPPLGILELDLPSLVPDDTDTDALPLLLAATPPRLAHQTHHGLFLGPALLFRHIRQICGPVPAAVVREGDAQPMHPEVPVQRRRNGLEVGE